MNSARENIAKWLEEFRAREHDNTTEIDVEFSDEEIAKANRAAESLGMTLNEYCNYALEIAIFSKMCPTCRQYRPERNQICNTCGEVD